MTGGFGENVICEDKQPAPPWVFAVLFAPIAIALIAVLAAGGGARGGHAALGILGLVTVFDVALAIAFSGVRTRVTDQGITARFGWLPGALRLGRDEIEWCRAITYHPLRDFGGWGPKSAHGVRAWTCRGNRGALLQARGRHFLVGSDDPEPIIEALNLIGVRTLPPSEGLRESMEEDGHP